MNLFDILGPVMVGPSSSHTAGAVRIGYLAYRLLQEEPVHAQIMLCGSFATTGVGHGTDKALIAGLLGMQPDDMRIPQSFTIAGKRGLSFSFETGSIKNAHPNTAVLTLEGKSGRKLTVQAASIGGGRVMIHSLDGVEVNFSAEKPTLVVYNEDRPGCVSEVATALSHDSINIATMHLYRHNRGGFAVMVLETDQSVPEEAIRWLNHLSSIQKVIYIDLNQELHQE